MVQDMLEVGNGMSQAQDQAHFSMWSIMSSPLVAGNDVRTMSNQTRAILTNRHVIAVNQDPLGKQARLVANSTAGGQTWAKELAGGSYAVALLNRGEEDAVQIVVEFAHLAVHVKAFEVFDLWENAKSLGVHHGSFSATVAPTSVRLLRLSP